MTRIVATVLLLSICIFLVVDNTSAQDFDDVQIVTIKAGDNVYLLKGAGGNIGLFASEDGNFLIDDQFAPLHEKLVRAITAVNDKPIRFLLNTHFHRDHTNGNELIGKTGSVIVAHENVRKRLSADMLVPYTKAEIPALPYGALPVATFTSDMSFHMGEERIDIHHVGPAHTDGDAIVVFNKANVIHAGDIYFSEIYPFVDNHNGGSFKGLLAALETILSFANDQTKIIPGHGAMTGKAEFLAYQHMLTTIYTNITELAKDGKTLEQIKAAAPTSGYDEGREGFVSRDALIGFIWEEIEGEK